MEISAGKDRRGKLSLPFPPLPPSLHPPSPPSFHAPCHFLFPHLLIQMLNNNIFLD